MSASAVIDAPPAPAAPAAPAPVPAAPAAPAVSVSPVEYVRGLSIEDKQAVFLTLLREALQYNGDAGLLPVEDENGRPFGYYVPPKAARAIFERYGPKLTEEDMERTRRALASLHRTVPFEEMLERLNRADGSTVG